MCDHTLLLKGMMQGLETVSIKTVILTPFY